MIKEPRFINWNPDIEWRLVPINESHQHIIFYRKAIAAFKLRISNELALILTEGRALDETYRDFLSFLDKRELIQKECSKTLVLRLFTSENNLVGLYNISSLVSLNIDLLIGDETSLAKYYDLFSTTRSEHTLIATVRIASDHIQISPVRFIYEAEKPVQVESTPRCYPMWQKQIGMITPILTSLLTESVRGSIWYTLTNNGFRMDLKWEKLQMPYRVQTKFIEHIRKSVPLVFVQSGIENKYTASGMGETISHAEYSGRCEAWERYCLDRPDLAIEATADSISNFLESTEILPIYFRELTKSGNIGPKYVQAQFLHSRKPLSVPCEWVYFNENLSAVNTSGTAFGNTLQEAEEYAQFELIERHSLLMVLFKLKGGQAFAFEQPDFIDDVQVRWYSLGCTNKIETVVCVIGASRPPFVCIGSAARYNREEAARKAFFEALATETIWGERLIKYGTKSFIDRGKKFLSMPPEKIGLIEGSWVWAADENSAEKLHYIFDQGQGGEEILDPDKFISVDVGRNILSLGAVARVMHPDALPLPSYHAHFLKLASLLKVEVPTFSLPIT